MFMIFFLATILTVRAFAFLDEYQIADWWKGDGVPKGAYYIFYGADSNLGFKAFGSFYLLFN